MRLTGWFDPLKARSAKRIQQALPMRIFTGGIVRDGACHRAVTMGVGLRSIHAIVTILQSLQP
jgi:hypothetical protein